MDGAATGRDGAVVAAECVVLTGSDEKDAGRGEAEVSVDIGWYDVPADIDGRGVSVLAGDEDTAAAAVEVVPELALAG